MNDTTIDTKQAQRRDNLRFTTTAELTQDLDRLESAHNAGVLRHTGNWQPGEVFDHVARFWLYALNGFPPHMKAPFLIRTLAKIAYKKKAAAGEPPPAGFKFPKNFVDDFSPEFGTDFNTGLARLRACVERTDNNEPFKGVSPLFGTFTRDEWVRLNLGHASLHLSFLHPD